MHQYFEYPGGSLVSFDSDRLMQRLDDSFFKVRSTTNRLNIAIDRLMMSQIANLGYVTRMLSHLIEIVMEQIAHAALVALASPPAFSLLMQYQAGHFSGLFLLMFLSPFPTSQDCRPLLRLMQIFYQVATPSHRTCYQDQDPNRSSFFQSQLCSYLRDPF